MMVKWANSAGRTNANIVEILRKWWEAMNKHWKSISIGNLMDSSVVGGKEENVTKNSWLKWHNGLSAHVSDLRPVMTITFSVRLSILRLKSTKSTSNFEFL